jgi:anaphase-promoting complex subunit 3
LWDIYILDFLANQIDPNFAYAYTLLGHEYIAIEELDKALANFRDAVRVDPRHYNAWYGIGLTYYKQERYQMADMYFRKSLTFNPTNPILMCHVAVVSLL